MSLVASQISSLTIVYLTVYSNADHEVTTLQIFQFLGTEGNFVW